MMIVGTEVELLKNKQQPGGPLVSAGTRGHVKNVFSGDWIYVDFGTAQIACLKTDVRKVDGNMRTMVGV